MDQVVHFGRVGPGDVGVIHQALESGSALQIGLCKDGVGEKGCTFSNVLMAIVIQNKHECLLGDEIEQDVVGEDHEGLI